MEYGQWPQEPAGEHLEPPQAAAWVDPAPLPGAAGPATRPRSRQGRASRDERRSRIPWGLLGWLLMVALVLCAIRAGVHVIDLVQQHSGS